MKYLSVCSGIEAATVAWHHLGWEAAGYSEIEPFPSAVLAHHYPHTPNLGDMNNHASWNIPSVDLLVGGTPCQSFSVAGLRRGLRDPRGGLMLTYLEIARDRRPRWVVWENVPGVLSSNGGRDFGSFLGALGDLGYGWAYRVLDAQWFGVAQRRRRVFVVGCLGDSRRAAAVLFERESVRRNPAPSREKRQETPSHAGRCAADGELNDASVVMGPITTGASKGNRGPMVADHRDCATDHSGHAYRMVAFGEYREDGTASSLKARDYKEATDLSVSNTLGRRGLRSHTELDGHGAYIPVGFAQNQRDEVRIMDVSGALAAEPGAKQQTYLHQFTQVRRLTPRECERLQGFPDDYTDIKPKGKDTPDGPRYKALGNSMAVPVMRWIGERINAQEAL